MLDNGPDAANDGYPIQRCKLPEETDELVTGSYCSCPGWVGLRCKIWWATAEYCKPQHMQIHNIKTLYRQKPKPLNELIIPESWLLQKTALQMQSLKEAEEWQILRI